MELKMEAARRRKSVAALVRENIKLSPPPIKDKKVDIKREIKELNTLAKRIAKQNKGTSLSQALIEMRYEQ